MLHPKCAHVRIHLDPSRCKHIYIYTRPEGFQDSTIEVDIYTGLTSTRKAQTNGSSVRRSREIGGRVGHAGMLACWHAGDHQAAHATQAAHALFMLSACRHGKVRITITGSGLLSGFCAVRYPARKGHTSRSTPLDDRKKLLFSCDLFLPKLLEQEKELNYSSFRISTYLILTSIFESSNIRYNCASLTHSPAAQKACVFLTIFPNDYIIHKGTRWSPVKRRVRISHSGLGMDFSIFRSTSLR
eukprot:1393094-Amorphochlora_amoeboformis.AAC.2